jgi:hypothetical protein
MLVNSASDEAMVPATCNLSRPNPEKCQGFMGGAFSTEICDLPRWWPTGPLFDCNPGETQAFATCYLYAGAASDFPQGAH